MPFIQYGANNCTYVCAYWLQTQTDHVQPELMMAESVDYDKLAAFLSRIFPKVIAELDKMHRSRAFDGYEPIEDNTDGAVTKLHTLQVPNINSQSEVLLGAMFMYLFLAYLMMLSVT
jgi:hypothetical protein